MIRDAFFNCLDTSDKYHTQACLESAVCRVYPSDNRYRTKLVSKIHLRDSETKNTNGHVPVLLFVCLSLRWSFDTY